MLNKTLALICALTLTVALGCGDEDGGGTLDQATASKAMSEAMTAGGTVYAKVSAELGKVAGTWLTPASGGGYTVAGTVNGPQGGTADVTGTASKSGSAYKMDLKMVFKDWKGSTGVTLSGTLNLAYDITSITAYKMVVKYSGDLEVEGAGNASFDLTITYAGMASVSVCGSVGGINISQGSCK